MKKQDLCWEERVKITGGVRMNHLGLKNFRCLKDTGDIEIRPITILLGENSAGKSTFLRVFPLLRQTFESRTRSPLLWFGRLVDFGEFDDVVFTGEKNREISVKIGSSMIKEVSRNLYSKELERTKYSIAIFIKKDEKDSTYSRKISIELFDQKIDLFIKKDQVFDKVLINGDDYVKCFENKSRIGSIGWIPSTKFKNSAHENYIYFEEFLMELIDFARSKIHRSYVENSIKNMLRKVTIDNNINMLENLKKVFKGKIRKENNFNGINIESRLFKDFRNLIIANFLPRIFNNINEDIFAISNSINYIDPLRATANRFYRFQDLSVDEIDSRGQNLPMFIDALPESQKKEFNEWTRKHFAFHVEPKKSSGHLSLMLVESELKSNNLADSGFGFSQILPIITQLWWQTKQSNNLWRKNPRNGNDHILVMEQPELHLHPKMQAMIADAFVAAIKTAKEKKLSLKIVAETHSEAIINRIGELIDKGEISKDDVNVVLFERDSADSPTTVRSVEFDEGGYLKNWPYGFFSSKR